VAGPWLRHFANVGEGFVGVPSPGSEAPL
jgi:hypothetical protein